MLVFAPIGAAQPTIDLLSEFHLRVDGPVARSLGYPIAVENAGDVNGDGRRDVIVGFRGQDAYVVFGRSSPGTVDLAALGTGGFRIDGAVEVDGSVEDVAGAGDVNGDGLADLVVGSGGGAFVVFGKSSTSPVDLSALGAGGFAISPPPGHSTPLGTCPGPDIGSSVDGIGDFNGDGRPDVVVAGPGPLISFCGDTAAWVVYGKASTGAVALGDPQGQAEFLWPGENAAGAGDVNGDGRPDVIVGTDIGGNGATVRFAGGGGFSMTGAGTGFSTAGVGDVNGDGLADVAVGAPDASNNGRPYSGSAWIVFGQTSSTDLDLMQLGTHGFRIDGAHGGDPGYVGDQAGWALDGAGDVNGDGRADVLLGAPGASNNGRRFSGSAFVVFGTPSTANVDLAALGAGGIRIDGAGGGTPPVPPNDPGTLGDQAGFSVAGGGDMTGDGRPDVLVGAPGTDYNGRSNSGSAYLVSFGAPDTTPPVLTVPHKVKVRAKRQTGARVYYSVSARDDTDPGPVITCSPPSGALFPIGRTTVTCTATDAAGNRATASFEVRVKRPKR
jgi:HYR domain/FG-GAP-like repeat/FG-GAP repeat